MSETSEHTILIADIVGSTRLYETLGDTKAKSLVTKCLNQLEDVANTHDGQVAAMLGDELVIHFNNPVKAATAANEMHVGAERENAARAEDEPPLKLRIGMHIGHIQVDPFDSVSDVLSIARRASELAKAEQTLITEQLLEELPGLYRAMTRFVDREPWRGGGTSSAWISVHELVWAVEGLTVSEPGAQIPASTLLRIRLRYAEQEWIADERRPVLSAGRANNNDIVVDSDLASREHFSIKFRDGKCTLTDMSRNATYVERIGTEAIRVWKEPAVLLGEGKLYFGEPAEENEAHAIIYRCE